MSIEYYKDVDGVGHVEVVGDGSVEIYYPNGGWGLEREDSIEFSIADLEKILKHAKAHHQAYVAYSEADYEDEVYERNFDHLIKD